jgi:hypothetical protein
MKKRFDVTIAGEINLDLILYGLPEVMPLERELLANDFRLTLEVVPWMNQHRQPVGKSL